MNQYQSDSIDQLITALAKAQGQMSSASKDTKGYNYKYADLASVWGACRDPLSCNGLAVTQIETQNERGDVLITILGHSSGQWVRSVMDIRVKAASGMNELQARGSVLTYLRRYALSAIVGIAPAEDDDGKGGSGYQATPETKQTVVPQVQNVDMITEFQIKQLNEEIIGCSTEFKKSIDEWMTANSIKSFAEFSKKTFLSILQRAVIDKQKMKNEAA
jgi:ERF superfamily